MIIRRDSRSPTVRDVAALAGVSPMTVSRVVGNVSTVNLELKDRVLEAIDQLGYEPNRTAAAMRNASSGGMAVGLCVESIENPFSASVARGLEESLRPHGGLLFSASSEGEPKTERDILMEFYRRRVDGLVVMTVCDDHEFLIPRVHPKVPIVYLDRPALLSGCDQVTTDHLQGAEECTMHLISQGHRRIGLVGSNLLGHPEAERLEGYRRALAKAGIQFDTDLLAALPGEAGATAAGPAVERLLRLPEPPTALFAASNSVMMVATQTLHRLGLADRIAHIIFDDICMDGIPVAEIVKPPLTVYAQDPVRLGHLCGEAILRRRGATQPLAPIKTVLAGQLIARGSGEIAPASSTAWRGLSDAKP